MKLGELIYYNKRKTFFEQNAEKDEGRLVQDLFLFLKRV